MQNISVLDCTLRDGGYVNNWNFGKKTIKSIIDKLNYANIDIVECGFLTEKIESENNSLFDSVSKIKEMIPEKGRNSLHVAMIAIGEKEIQPEKLEECDGNSIDGIRLTFHQHEIDKAIAWAKILMGKGYKVFMQPVGTISYTDLEVLKLVEKINALNPYAFYIVDTLGSMSRNELLHTFYNIDANLKSGIKIGFHPHNNRQLAFSNAQALSRIHTQRDIIIDSSVYGMGRAAGNLPTELITEYINKNIEHKYNVTTILDIYDEYISFIREEYKWGYEVPYYIAACNKCHPNYAVYLTNKQTLTMQDIEKIILMIPEESRVLYNKKLIEKLYLDYQNKKMDDQCSVEFLSKEFDKRKILVLAPGKSILTEKEKISEFIKNNNPYVISVNFVDSQISINTCFTSNHKRIENILSERKNISLIISSNIKLDNQENVTYVDYISCINNDEMVYDNSGLMLLKLLSRCGVNEVALAGFDGFKTRYDENYYDEELALQVNEEELKEKQSRIRNQLLEITKGMKIEFLTKSVYEDELDV